MNKTAVFNKYLATEDETLAFGSHVANVIETGMVIFLYGPLGAGKTLFTRGFLRGLGYMTKVKSPTFTLVEPYELGEKKVFHFDFYRLTDPHELEHIGIKEYFTADSVCLIEWPEKGFPLLPSPDLACYFAFNDKGRDLRIEAQSMKGVEILRRL